MIESLAIENFRCFERVELANLRRINVIVGDNGSGKTSFVEAILLAATGHPAIALRLRALRGLGEAQVSLERQSFEYLWKDLFFRFEQNRIISLAVRGSAENTRSTRLRYSPEAESVSVAVGNSLEDTSIIIPLIFEHQRGSEEPLTFPVKIEGGELKITGAAEAMPISSFPAYVRPNPQELAGRFSSVVTKKLKARFMETFQGIYPEVLDCVVVATPSGISLLHVDVGHIPETVPLSLYSDGAYRLASYLLAIATTENGVVCIDEIENGFYHKRMPDIWRALYKFCHEYDVQLFAPTHSLEALRALVPIVCGNENDFCLLRTEKDNEGHFDIRQFDGILLKDAIEQQAEIR